MLTRQTYKFYLTPEEYEQVNEVVKNMFGEYRGELVPFKLVRRENPAPIEELMLMAFKTMPQEEKDA
jgi:hypothetical protein